MTERPIFLPERYVKAVLAGRMSVLARVVSPQPAPFVQATPDRHPPKHEAPYIDAYCSERKTDENPRGMSDVWCWWTRDDRQGAEIGRCPYGAPGTRLWVRERWQPVYNPPFGEHDDCWSYTVKYAAGGADFTTDELGDNDWRDPHTKTWLWSGTMPRWASRLLLAVRSVRIVRLHDLTEDDALRHGFEPRAGQDFWSCFCERTHDLFEMTVEPDDEYRREHGITHVKHMPGERHTALQELAREWNKWAGCSFAANPWVWLVGFEVAELRGDADYSQYEERIRQNDDA